MQTRNDTFHLYYITKDAKNATKGAMLLLWIIQFDNFCVLFCSVSLHLLMLCVCLHTLFIGEVICMGDFFFHLAVAFGTEHTSSERNPNNIYWIEEYLYTHTHTPCHIRSNDSQMKSTEHLESLGSGCAIELGQFYCEEKGNIHMCPAITMITFRIEWNAGRNK